MPIYMDRHDTEGATAKAVADAHQKDLKLQDKYGVKLLTYWFDEDRGSAFCLMDASAKDKVKQLHEEAHGMIPHKIMEVNPDTVEAFLGRKIPGRLLILLHHQVRRLLIQLFVLSCSQT